MLILNIDNFHVLSLQVIELWKKIKEGARKTNDIKKPVSTQLRGWA